MTELHADVRNSGGTGVPFLLVHGLASNARLWDGVARRLADAGHPVAAVDLRGHGRSPKPDDGYDFETMGDDLVAAVQRLGWKQPVAVGQSMGGNLVLDLARRRPELWRGVAGVDGGTIELAERFPTWESCWAALAPPPLDGTPVAEVERRLRAEHPGWAEEGIAGALACFEVREDGTVAPWLTRARHQQVLRSLWGHRPSTFYEELEVPVLLVPAGGAVTVPPIPKVHVHPLDGDHDLHAQFPDRVASLLREAFA